MVYFAVGAPIRVEKQENPTHEDIDRVHAEYVKALVALINEHKKRFGIDDDVQLHVL